MRQNWQSFYLIMIGNLPRQKINGWHVLVLDLRMQFVLIFLGSFIYITGSMFMQPCMFLQLGVNANMHALFIL